jgi:hypothetical protein
MTHAQIIFDADVAGDIKERANHEAPWSVVLFSRLRNIAIKNQILDILFLANGGRIQKTVLEQKYYADLEMIQKDTDVIFSEHRSKTREHGKNKKERVSLGYFDALLGRKHTWRERHITEAHEKGHVIRWDYSVKRLVWSNAAARLEPRYCLSGHFSPAFDFSRVRFSEEECEKRRKCGTLFCGKTDHEIWRTLVSYLSGPHELAERMSQLKNYFGFGGNEIFTAKHLSYVRKYYVKDTGYDNMMTQFFQSVSPERENAFLALINSAGI